MEIRAAIVGCTSGLVPAPAARAAGRRVAAYWSTSTIFLGPQHGLMAREPLEQTDRERNLSEQKVERPVNQGVLPTGDETERRQQRHRARGGQCDPRHWIAEPD